VAATVAVVFALAAGSGASQRPAAGRSVDASGHNRALARLDGRAHRLTVVLIGPGRVGAGPFTFTSRWRIRRAAGLINALPSAPPGAFACPMDRGYRLRLTFSSGQRQLAVVTIDPGGCQDVSLILRGRAQRPLTALPLAGSGISVGHPLIDRLDRTLGLRLAGKLRAG
jgi:hypothetical protein